MNKERRLTVQAIRVYFSGDVELMFGVFVEAVELVDAPLQQLLVLEQAESIMCRLLALAVGLVQLATEPLHFEAQRRVLLLHVERSATRRRSSPTTVAFCAFLLTRQTLDVKTV